MAFCRVIPFLIPSTPMASDLCVLVEATNLSGNDQLQPGDLHVEDFDPVGSWEVPGDAMKALSDPNGASIFSGTTITTHSFQSHILKKRDCHACLPFNQTLWLAFGEKDQEDTRSRSGCVPS